MYSARKKNFDKGIVLLSRAVALQPSNADVIYKLAIFTKIIKMDEAISCYEKTISLKNDYPEALNNLGFVWLNLSNMSPLKLAFVVQCLSSLVLHTHGSILLIFLRQENLRKLFQAIVRQ